MKIYVIFIVACLIESLKADVYSVKLNRTVKGDKSLTSMEWDSDLPTSVTFLNDVNPEDFQVTATILDSWGLIINWFEVDDPCDMDPSTEKGTIAAILWKLSGIDSCPIVAGKYPIAQNFNQTGKIEGTFHHINETVTIIFDVSLKSNSRKRYFRFLNDVRLLEGTPINYADA